MLGFGPCYHMVNVLTDLPLSAQWAAAMDGAADWDEIFGEHQSFVDWPGASSFASWPRPTRRPRWC